MNNSKIKNSNAHQCISCGSNLTDDLVEIGNQFPSAIFLEKKDAIPNDLTPSSLNLSKCENENCGLVQLTEIKDLQYVFDHYPYESGSTATMKEKLKSIVDDSLNYVKLSEEDIVLDIGGNDGTMLSLIDQKVFAKVNIDAASGVKQRIEEKNYYHVHSKFNYESYNSLNLVPPKLIFSVAMFYHLSDPKSFCKDIAKVMSEDSIWVLQMTYLGSMLKDNIFDNIVHEHVAYYSLKSLKFLLNMFNLNIIESKIVDSYGGSLRVYIKKNTTKKIIDSFRKEYYKIQKFETKNNTNTFQGLWAFNERTQLLKSTLKNIINHINEIHGPLVGFGASTKGNMILQLLNLDEKNISCVLDNSLKKIGTYLTGNNIPILDETLIKKKCPKYIIILPYYYESALLAIIKKILPKGSNTSVLVPLPKPHFINIKN